MKNLRSSPKNLFLRLVVPLYSVSVIILQFHKSDIGGAEFDTQFHLGLMRYIAKNSQLPNPIEYKSATLPVWHFLGAFFLRIDNRGYCLHLFQFVIAILTLWLVYDSLRTHLSNFQSALGVSALGANSYFVSASFYPNTDCIAIFSYVLFFNV
jgi:hypothetical protein